LINSESNPLSHFEIRLYFLNGCLDKTKGLLDSRIFLFLIEDLESLIPFQDIEFDVGLQLPEADHTKIHGLFLAFLQMVAPIHDALVEYAVPHSEHVRYLVGHHAHRTVLYEAVVYLIRLLAKKTFIITRKRENPSPLPNAGQSEHKIPLLFGVEIRHADPDQTEGVHRKLLLEDGQDVPGVVLLFLSVGVNSFGDSLHGVYLSCYLDLHGEKEALAKELQLLQETSIYLFQGLDVDGVSLFVDFVVHLALIGVVGLSLFLMFPQPLALDGLVHGLEHVLNTLQAFLDPVGQPRQAAQSQLPLLSIWDLVVLLHFF
jgi:hypothetical protein